MQPMNYKKEGSITVFLSVSMLLIFSLLLSVISSAIYYGGKLRVVSAVDLAVKSLQADYDRKIYDEYGLMLLSEDNKAILMELLEEYMSYNVDVTKNIGSSNTDFYGITIDSISINNVVTPRDDYGLPFENLVCDYMEIAAPIGIGESLMNKFMASDKSSSITKVTSSIDTLSSQAIIIDESIDKFIEYADGVKKQGNEVVIKDSFAKQLCYGSITMYDIAVNDASLYNRLRYYYMNTNTMSRDIEKLVNSIKTSLNNNQSSSADEKKLKEKLTELEKKVNSAETKLLLAKTEIDKIYSANENLKNAVTSSTKVINGLKEALGEELHKEMLREVEQYSNYLSQEKVLNIEAAKNAVYGNINAISQMKTYIKLLKGNINSGNVDNFVSYAVSLKDALYSYNIRDIKIDYSKLNLNKSTDSGVLKTIQNTLTEGFLGLVIQDVDNISQKSINNPLWVNTDFSNIDVDNYSGDTNVANRATKNILVNEYCMKKFKSYTQNTVNCLNYEVEYIISGKGNDKENLASVVSKIVLLRQGTNFMYLLTDSEKKSQAYTLAVALAGASGVPVLVTATKWLILGLWAYAEAIIDARNLLEGKGIPLIKNRSNFKLTLENLLNMNLEGESTSLSNGVHYDDYLKLLLYTGNKCEKYNRMMNVIEMKMYSNDIDFSMGECVYGLSVEVLAGIRNNRFSYTEKTAFCY